MQSTIFEIYRCFRRVNTASLCFLTFPVTVSLCARVLKTYLKFVLFVYRRACRFIPLFILDIADTFRNLRRLLILRIDTPIYTSNK